ncbi:MAG: hypothetical protein V4537_16800 [Pseudomonadota bacterium]
MSDEQPKEPVANEIVAAAEHAKAAKARAGKDKANWPLIGLGVGIGSAAVAAALLYANRDKND